MILFGDINKGLRECRSTPGSVLEAQGWGGIFNSTNAGVWNDGSVSRSAASLSGVSFNSNSLTFFCQ